MRQHIHKEKWSSLGSNRFNKNVLSNVKLNIKNHCESFPLLLFFSLSNYVVLLNSCNSTASLASFWLCMLKLFYRALFTFEQPV